ncbi:(Fe-S)-binding protein [Paenibacillus puerhi]|uniref:(Fe-S)-binding protein n=1 Tax=Paenibacillus puerhi TaxID=2692622 RepID=UPI00135A27B0|nr:(Fe-S)-binding protein [Paenibacillus puerhi]
MSGSVSIKERLAREGGSPLAERMKLSLDYDELTNCMRCGFCQPACPTFRETGLEAASPRGRIALMKAVVDDVMEPDQSFREQMDLCLGCRACEPVCPADVKYGTLLEQTKEALEHHADHRLWIQALRSITFKHLFPQQKRMKLLGKALRLYQRSGMSGLVRSSGLMSLFPAHMRQMERILPEASGSGVIEQLGVFVPAKGTPVGRVGLFRGCIMDVLYTETNVRTARLLSEAGYDVVIPETQNCCGALHAHGGELDQARELARSNIRTFLDAKVDKVVSNAGGCGALLVEYGHLLHDDPSYAELALDFAGRVKDVSELLLERASRLSFDSAAAYAESAASSAGLEAAAALQEKTPTSSGLAPVLPSLGAGRETVTYQDSCHLRNVMKAGNAPRNLIGRVGNVNVVELQGADRCCGSAGIYNLTQPEMSMQVLDHKMEHVKETRAHVVLTSNPGCLLQMQLGIEREGLTGRMKAEHVVDYLYERLLPAAEQE